MVIEIVHLRVCFFRRCVAPLCRGSKASPFFVDIHLLETSQLTKSVADGAGAAISRCQSRCALNFALQNFCFSIKPAVASFFT